MVNNDSILTWITTKRIIVGIKGTYKTLQTIRYTAQCALSPRCSTIWCIIKVFLWEISDIQPRIAWVSSFPSQESPLTLFCGFWMVAWLKQICLLLFYMFWSITARMTSCGLKPCVSSRMHRGLNWLVTRIPRTPLSKSTFNFSEFMSTNDLWICNGFCYLSTFVTHHPFFNLVILKPNVLIICGCCFHGVSSRRLHVLESSTGGPAPAN
jgi:hypothetical protein